MNKYPRIGAYLFDMDGTLVETERFWSIGLCDLLRADGFELPFEEAYRIVCGHSWNSIYQDIVARFPSEGAYDVDAQADRLKPCYLRAREGADLTIPGSTEAFLALARHTPCAIVSGSRREDVEETADLLGIRDSIALIVGAQDCPGEVFISEPYIDIITGDMCFTVSTMLSDNDTVIGADYNFTKLQESIARMTEGTDRTALIVTKKGMIVGYTDMSYVGEILNLKLSEYSDIFARVTASKTHPSFRISLNGRRQTIFSSETSNQWYMILCVDNWALYRDGYRQLIINTAINLLLVIVIIVFYLMSVHNRIKSEKALEVKEEFLLAVDGFVAGSRCP